MTPLEVLLAHLLGSLAGPAGSWGAPALSVTDLDFDIPIETRFAGEGVVLATLPRGLLATGFELPLGHLRVRCGEVGP